MIAIPTWHVLRIRGLDSRGLVSNERGTLHCTELPALAHANYLSCVFRTCSHLLTDNLQGTQESFEACHSKTYIKEWMDWQNCIEFEQPVCIIQTGLKFPCINILPKWMQGISPILDWFICGPCRLTGFYLDEQNEKVEVQALHSQAHVRFGKDLLDITTSPNDVGPFMGYHANLDRNNMIWMMETKDTLESSTWGYPASQEEYKFKNDAHLSGPFAKYGDMICGSIDPSTYPDYDKELAWFEGTLVNDTLNAGYPFTDIFETPPANGVGYTHWEGEKTSTVSTRRPLNFYGHPDGLCNLFHSDLLQRTAAYTLHL